jgi:hypothetical protein
MRYEKVAVRQLWRIGPLSTARRLLVRRCEPNMPTGTQVDCFTLLYSGPAL